MAVLICRVASRRLAASWSSGTDEGERDVWDPWVFAAIIGIGYYMEDFFIEEEFRRVALSVRVALGFFVRFGRTADRHLRGHSDQGITRGHNGPW